MGPLLEALFALAVVVAGVWFVIVARTEAAERQEAELAAAEKERRRRHDEKIDIPGEPLRCLNCDTCFEGPVTDDGCPSCHLATLIVTEEEYEHERRQTIQEVRDTAKGDAK